MLLRAFHLLLSMAAIAAVLSGPARAQQPLATKPAEATPVEVKPVEVKLGLLTRAVPPPPLYDLLAVPEDDAVAGAELAVKDNNTTGLFTGQSFALETTTLAEDEDAAEAARALAEGGTRLLLVNLPGDDLLKVADAVKDKGVVVFNVGASDDALRAEECRANVFHVAPSRAMLTDALAQFLAAKRWSKLFLIVGPQPADLLYAEALRRSAKKFGLKVVADKPWTFGPLGRDRSDSITRSDALVFSRGVDADVIVVADEANDFGNYIPFRTFEPRLVAGTQGLTASTWHPAQDAWGSAQLQSRFLRAASRTMRPADYQAWVAARMIGEAATRTGGADPAAIAKFLRTPDFSLAAFKGVPVSIRPWDQQLRQPLLIAQPLGIVSVAPEEGFLHQRTPLDTLGTDAGESRCRLK
ncbi:ABC transporter substrate-binding protein [Xanthobacter dioxanivorans]|uniref:ABC transporter substrate-binding protein n=1 Tax=Xanthobacter dioxanivorans TaxID=2528964 RepID=A0A974PS45_9HYPH|nr:ABC transporter substrate-binding protein [Xanthobacter dioxanivorans]QRG08150.1 ABC transporter substrate-binding protein [Xanthobacter dioxanivorans]